MRLRERIRRIERQRVMRGGVDGDVPAVGCDQGDGTVRGLAGEPIETDAPMILLTAAVQQTGEQDSKRETASTVTNEPRRN